MLLGLRRPPVSSLHLCICPISSRRLAPAPRTDTRMSAVAPPPANRWKFTAKRRGLMEAELPANLLFFSLTDPKLSSDDPPQIYCCHLGKALSPGLLLSVLEPLFLPFFVRVHPAFPIAAPALYNPAVPSPVHCALCHLGPFAKALLSAWRTPSSLSPTLTPLGLNKACLHFICLSYFPPEISEPLNLVRFPSCVSP